MDNTTQDPDDLLSELNDEKARLFIPAIVYVGVLMLVGTTGNILVLYFYGCKTKTTPSTSFILALALFDLASCIVGMPMEIADLRYYFNFKSELACKILRCVTHFASISSGLTLVIIAVDRHRRICKPFERQLNNKHVKFICLSTGFLAVALSVPAIFFNEVVDVDIHSDDRTDLIGKDCTTSKAERLKPYILAFNAVYLLAFVLITTILSILYSLIGRQLCRHQKFRSYVARGGTKVKRITVRSQNESSANLLSYHKEASTLSNKVFADPPDATDSIVDMKEFVTRGLTQVETNRPSSGYTAVTGTTGLTGLTGMTDICGRSRGTMPSVKSVTICDPSKNQIIPIEARVTRLRQTISNSESTWSSIEGKRPGSADSFTSVSTRPISPNETPKNHFIQGNMIENENVLYSNRAVQKDSDENAIESDDEADDVENEHDADDDEEFSGQAGELKEEIELPIIEHKMNEITDDNENREVGIQDKTSTDNIKRSNSEVSEIRLAETERETVASQEENRDIDPSIKQQEKDTQEKDVINEIKEKADNNRPSSSGSILSDKSKSSKGSRRSAVVSPMSCVTTSTVASRASSVKKMKRMLHRNEKRSGKLTKDSDNMKELRLKMLDLNTVKYTMIMIIITILFVISFLPYLALVIWRYYQKEHEMNILTDTELVLFQIGIRSVFLNSSLNPMIYGGFNSKFRTFFYKTLCGCCTFKKRKRKTVQQPRDQSDSTSGS